MPEMTHLNTFEFVAEVTFKACVCYFKFLFFHQMTDSPLKIMKNVFYFI